jgi:RimJ/RimL family protein N-acetyltransferase
MEQALPFPPEAATRRAPVIWLLRSSRLGSVDRAAVRRHMQALGRQGCELRFGAALAADAIERYVAGMDFERDLILGLRAQDGSLCGLVEILRIGRSETAEIAFSVDPAWRGRGLGKALMQLAMTSARMHAIGRIVAQVSPVNRPMLAILRRAGMRLALADGELVGTLDLPATDAPHLPLDAAA